MLKNTVTLTNQRLISSYLTTHEWNNSFSETQATPSCCLATSDLHSIFFLPTCSTRPHFHIPGHRKEKLKETHLSFQGCDPEVITSTYVSLGRT